ncbi:hypothetical protein KIW84_014882 [Lathyrus oleraceus]|uniref:DUF4283 domain-containing protein n=1 Tax=Pisum sativum TaxID=3888 RepID=A0A9D5GZU8_PEA|nr:hypothetical protein KIW84_014882 [Pisum sativum]
MCVKSITSWNLSLGFLKLFPWTNNFNPTLLKQPSAQVWICIYGLPQEYWCPKFVFGIASSVGIPLNIDSAFNKCCFERPFGHFVMVNNGLNATKNTTKEKANIIDLEARPLNVSTAIEKGVDKVSEEEDSIENSSFIDNTQRNSGEEVPETNLELQQDMMFLNSSWDNMVHLELEKQGIGDNAQKSMGVDFEGFKRVKSKSKRKAQK